MILVSAHGLGRQYSGDPIFTDLAFEIRAGGRGGLGFATADFGRAASTFSGGQQSRLMLAKLLLQSPDLMLLDEPSNHLDIETTAWLESYLSRQSVGMVIVSHDRYFLDKTVTKI